MVNMDVAYLYLFIMSLALWHLLEQVILFTIAIIIEK